MKKHGKVRAIGVSNWEIATIQRMIGAIFDWFPTVSRLCCTTHTVVLVDCFATDFEPC